MKHIALLLSLFLASASAAGILGSIKGAASSVYNAGYGAATRVKDGIAFYLPKLGTCPEMPAQQNRAEDTDDILGSWYIQSALGHEVLQGQARYMSANVAFAYETNVLTINVQQLSDKTHKWGHLVANAKVLNKTADEFKFQASFNLPFYGQVGGTYTLIQSDFTRFGVVHGCGTFLNLLYYDIIWLVSREQKMSPKTQKDFDSYTLQALSMVPHDPSKFKKIVQKNTAEPDD